MTGIGHQPDGDTQWLAGEIWLYRFQPPLSLVGQA